MKILRKTSWEEIKIGEIFAGNGCWNIAEKIDDKHLRFLATDFHEFNGYGDIVKIYNDDATWFGMDDLYKLPISVQRNWNHLL